MSTSVSSSTSAHAYQVAQRQTTSERRETVENDKDGDDAQAVAKTRQTHNAQHASAMSHAQATPPAQEANKGQNVDYYA